MPGVGPADRDPAPQARGTAELAAELTAMRDRLNVILDRLASADVFQARAASARPLPEPTYLSAAEAARLAGVTVETLKSWCRRYGFGWRQKLPDGRLGRWRVERVAYLSFLQQRAEARIQGRPVNKP